jgi:hypothetical protein
VRNNTTVLATESANPKTSPAPTDQPKFVAERRRKADLHDRAR